MKAALLGGGVDSAHIVDLAHDLPAHGVREAAFLLREMARSFPSTAVHLAVIDPGVGGRRAAIVVETRAGPVLIGPDNGVLMPLATELGLVATHRIEGDKLSTLPRVGTTFDGRDLFAPAAAFVARGGRPVDLGPAVRPTPYFVPVPRRLRDGARGEVLHVDRFGNLITNVPSAWHPGAMRAVLLRVDEKARGSAPWVTSYESLGRGTLGALGSSFGTVEVAVGEGRASDRLRAGVGAAIEFTWPPRPVRRGENANSARPRKRA